MSTPSKIRRKKAEEKRLAARNLHFPKLEKEKLWDWINDDGWFPIPKTMPIFLEIMDVLSKGKPVSKVYLELWSRTWNDSYVPVKTPREMAFHSGFSGQRAESTWRDRMRILKRLGFIDFKPGPTGPVSYVIINNPYTTVHSLQDDGELNTNMDLYYSFIERANEIGSKNV